MIDQQQIIDGEIYAEWLFDKTPVKTVYSLWGQGYQVSLPYVESKYQEFDAARGELMEVLFH